MEKEKSNDDALLALIYDARRFIRSNRFAIEKAPLQLYYAGLLFSPERSLVRKQYYSGIPFIQWDPTVEQQWSPLIQTFEGHLPGARTLVFSPDGKLIASASASTVRLYDPTTGESCGVLQGHSDDVRVVVFSPDRKLVASASFDKTVRLWDVISKTTIEEIHTGALIWCLNFTDRTQLHTNWGMLTLISQLHPSTSTQATFPPSIYVTQDGWVTLNKKRVLFLPVDYRPRSLTVKDNILVLGHEFGYVNFIHFNPTAFAL